MAMIPMKVPSRMPLLLLAVLFCLSPFGASSFSIVVPTTTRTSPAMIQLSGVSDSGEGTPSVASETAPKEASDAAPKANKKAPPEPPPIDVSKLDIRVGLIEKCWEHEEADKLYCEEIDLGEEGGPRRIASGLKSHYTVEEMVGKKVLVLANLKSRKLVGFPSHGMVLCAFRDGENDGAVEFVCPPEDALVGDRVVCPGYEGEPATENQVAKKKMLNLVFPDLKVNAEGIAVYKDVPLVTATGGETIRAETLKDVPIS